MYRTVVGFLAATAFGGVFAQQIWVTSPGDGDVLYINDTISINFEADSAYLQQASSTVIKISLNAGFD